MDTEDPHNDQVIPGAWRENFNLADLEAMRGNNATKAAKAQREYLKLYYNSDVGRVDWQDRMV